MWIEACFAHSTGYPSFALLLGVAHLLLGNTIIQTVQGVCVQTRRVCDALARPRS